MKLWIICRRVGDETPSFWGPGWAGVGAAYTLDDACSKCIHMARVHNAEFYTFSVVVAEFDP